MLSTFSLEVREHVDVIAGLENRGFPWNQWINESSALEEGRGLSLDSLVVTKYIQTVNVLKLPDMICLVHLE